jgi:hypothetical protein
MSMIAQKRLGREKKPATGLLEIGRMWCDFNSRAEANRELCLSANMHRNKFMRYLNAESHHTISFFSFSWLC